MEMVDVREKAHYQLRRAVGRQLDLLDKHPKGG